MGQAPSTYCILYFSSFVPLTAWTHKAMPVPHRLEFIYGEKSIEVRHISICFLAPPQGESFVYLFKLRSAIRVGPLLDCVDYKAN